MLEYHINTKIKKENNGRMDRKSRTSIQKEGLIICKMQMY
jgi:hypothetical protein